MGFKSVSTRRTTATSAVSNQAVVVNTGTGSLSVAGSKITDATSITLGVVTPGQSSANSSVAAQGGPVISTITYLDANNNPTTANAVSTSGGNIKISGTGFVTGSSVYINNSLVSNTFVSSTEIRAVCPAASAGNVSILLFTPTDVGTQKANAVRYSGAPTWTTAAATLVNGTAANVALVASSDSTLTFTLQAGSTLPTGISLQSAGYLTGTPTGYSGTTAITVVIVATDQEGQGTQQTINITVTSGDDYFDYTTLLLNGDTGTNVVNNATNNVFLDSSSNNFTVTRTGTTTQGSFSPFSQTGWSVNTNTAASQAGAVLLPTAANTSAAGDFTIECWAMRTAISSFNCLAMVSGSSASSIVARFTAAGATLVLNSTIPNTTANANTFAAIGRWFHYAVVRQSGTMRVYIDGVQVFSAANATTYNLTGGSGSTQAQIGNYNGNTGQEWVGYVSNYRIVNGTAVYPDGTTFTPSVTPLTAISGTVVLTAQSNRFLDVGPNSLALTSTGTPSVQAFSPFAPSASYVAETNGGSAYLDGSGNYLSLATNAALNITSGSTDSFICEFWVNWSTVAANMSIVDNGGLNNVSFANWSITLNASSQITLNWASSGAPGSTIGTLPTSIVPVVGQWYHIAFVKTNADWAVFVNGTRATNFSGLNTASKTSATALYVGYGLATSAAGGNAFKGYISNIRIYKGASGSAPYAATSTTITVPTAPVTAITNTQMLTNFTNGGIVDAHSSNALQTAGDAKLSTSVTKFGTASMAFDGTGDYLSAPYNPLYALETGDFTVEAWVYRSVTGAEHNIAVTRSAGGSDGWNLRINSSNTLQFYYTGGSSLTSTGTIPATTWTHVAVTKSGNTVRLFINGNIDGSNAAFGTGNANTQPLRIGVANDNTTGYMNGYIDDLRITKGFARYTANFPVPTSAFQGQ